MVTITAAIAPTSANINECASLRSEEWDVLQAIYPDFVSNELSDGGFKLEIPIEFEGSRKIIVSNEGVPASASVSRLRLMSNLSALPPILLDVLLPTDYPLLSSPQLLSVHATNSWIPTSALRDRLLALWQPGEGVLCRWVEELNGGNFLEAIGVMSSNGSNIHIRHPAPQLLVPFLEEHDRTVESAKFSQTSYSCSVCLTSVKGARCIRLSCEHVFCRSCLGDFWSLFIKEGDVSRVGCPDPTCVKENRTASEEELRRVVTEKDITRWKWLVEKQMLEKDPTIIHCPIQVCQRPVPAPKGAITESGGWERLRSCQSCGYSFCAFCRRTWHGPISECPLPATESLVQEYTDLPEGSAGRKLLESRYGKANLQRLIRKIEEEKANQVWIESSTQECPYCSIHVEKSMGCNHMTCGRCRGHFCYRCGAKLLASNPYTHFSNAGTSCFNKLFDVEPEDNGWQPMEGFDHI